MAGAQIKYDLGGLRSISAAVAELERRGKNTEPLMDEIGSILVASTIDRFEREIDPDGRPWKPSARAKQEHGKTLTDSARLRTSITHRPVRHKVDVGSNVAYAAIHQFGGKIEIPGRSQTLAFSSNSNKFASRRSTRARKAGAVRVAFATIRAHVVEMPERPYLGIGPSDPAAIEDAVNRFHGGAFK